MWIINTLLGIGVVGMVVLTWTLPFKEKIFRWFDERWGPP